VGETITVNEDNNDGLAFEEAFTPLITVSFLFARTDTAYYGFSWKESYVLTNQTGCTNGVDVEGNMIDKVLLSALTL
jgi:hypothetical protein